MNAEYEIFQKVMKSVSDRVSLYLRDTIGVSISSLVASRSGVDTLVLRDITGIMGIGSPISMLVAFSLDRSLAEHVTDIETKGLRIADDEREMFVRETVAETINVILGNCTSDLADTGQILTLSPPIVIKEEHELHRPKEASFTSLSFTTNRGVLKVGFIAPPHLFDEELRSVSGKEPT